MPVRSASARPRSEPLYLLVPYGQHNVSREKSRVPQGGERLELLQAIQARVQQGVGVPLSKVIGHGVLSSAMACQVQSSPSPSAR
jgi:hypothetical protein